MSVMGFQKSMDRGWAGWVSSIQFYVGICFKFAKPLNQSSNANINSTRRSSLCSFVKMIIRKVNTFIGNCSDFDSQKAPWKPGSPGDETV